MVEVIKNSISKDFDGICFNLEDWNVVLNNSSEVEVAHLKSSIEYNIAYFKGENLSFLLHDNNKVVGVFPLFAHKNEGFWIISCDGESLIRPLFINNISKKVKKRLENKIVTIINFISQKLEIKLVKFFDSNMALSSWYLLWLRTANNIFVTHELMVDLRWSIDEIRLCFRKSYKPLTNKTFKEWDVSVFDGTIDDTFEEFRLLHKVVAGRETRSRESWYIQKMQIMSKNAFLVTIRDKDILIGAGFFTYTKDIGFYAVGAYKRELFDKPIGHIVQMKAIEVLKEKGCKLYHMGQKKTPLDNHNPSEKEISISNFKEGFSSYVCIRPHLEVLINE